MHKHYIIIRLESQEYIKAMFEGSTKDIREAGVWPDEESAELWIHGLAKGFHYTIQPVYILYK